MKFLQTLIVCTTCTLAVPTFANADSSASPEAAAPVLEASAGVPPGGPNGAPHGPGHGAPQFGPGFGMHGPHPGDHPEGPPEAHAAIETIDEIEGLYLDTGRANELPAFYRATLTKTHDPMLRNLLLHRLADTQLKPAHADEAIATLGSALDETLARLDSMAPPAPAHQ